MVSQQLIIAPDEVPQLSISDPAGVPLEKAFQTVRTNQLAAFVQLILILKPPKGSIGYSKNATDFREVVAATCRR